MEKLRDMFLQDISVRERDRLCPQGLTDGMAIELWDFNDAVEGLNTKAVSEAIYELGKTGKVNDVVNDNASAIRKTSPSTGNRESAV